MSRRILVTGATGETGRYTTDLLISQGFEIPLCAQTFAGDLVDRIPCSCPEIPCSSK